MGYSNGSGCGAAALTMLCSTGNFKSGHLTDGAVYADAHRVKDGVEKDTDHLQRNGIADHAGSGHFRY